MSLWGFTIIKWPIRGTHKRKKKKNCYGEVYSQPQTLPQNPPGNADNSIMHSIKLTGIKNSMSRKLRHGKPDLVTFWGCFSEPQEGFDFKPRVLAARTQISDGRQPRGLRLLQLTLSFLLFWTNEKNILDFAIKMCQAEITYVPWQGRDIKPWGVSMYT